jgi:DHA1 family multidrug resistance protein-like MFS transporter
LTRLVRIDFHSHLLKDVTMNEAGSLKQPKVSSSVLYRPILMVSLPFAFLGFTLPIYSKGLGASALEIGGLYSVFTITLLVGRPLVGRALDLYGRRRFFIAAQACYSVSMIFFAFAANLVGLYLARFAQGIASSLMWITVYTIISDLSGPGERGQAVGRINEADARGEVIGVFIGYAIFRLVASQSSEANGWKVTYLVFAILTVYAVWLAWKKVPETRQSTQPARVPRSLTRSLFNLLVVVFITGAATALISPIYLIFLQDRFTTDVGVLAWSFFPAGIVASFLPSHLGKLSDRFGRAPMMAGGLVGAGLLSLLLPGLPSLLWVVLLYTISAVGWAMAGPAEAAMVADLTGADTRGAGYGLYEFAASLGATLGPLVGGWVYDSYGKAVPFYLDALLLGIGAVWVLLFLKRPARSAPLNGDFSGNTKI